MYKTTTFWSAWKHTYSPHMASELDKYVIESVLFFPESKQRRAFSFLLFGSSSTKDNFGTFLLHWHLKKLVLYVLTSIDHNFSHFFLQKFKLYRILRWLLWNDISKYFQSNHLQFFCIFVLNRYEPNFAVSLKEMNKKMGLFIFIHSSITTETNSYDHIKLWL